MKKNKMQNNQVYAPEKNSVCVKCFYNFHDRTSKTGFYCIKTHEEVLPNGSC